MTIAIDHESTAAAAASGPFGDYPNLVVVNFGRPRFDYCPVNMRDLIQWTSGILDGEGGNHRTASLLRAIAEQFYPNQDDLADWIHEDHQDRGIEIDFDFDEVFPPVADQRLLGLVDGYALCTETFDEALWDGQQPTPVLARNAANYLDFDFPDEAFERYAIRGIRVYCLDLIYWMRSGSDLGDMAYQDEDAWLDAWELSSDRHRVNEKYRSEVRVLARHGDKAVDAPFDASSGGATDPEEQDAILDELSGLI
jgi:hypothetical protein